MILCIITEVLITLALLPIAAAIAILLYYIFGYILLFVLFMVCHYTIAEAHREAVNGLRRPLLK